MLRDREGSVFGLAECTGGLPLGRASVSPQCYQFQANVLILTVHRVHKIVIQKCSDYNFTSC